MNKRLTGWALYDLANTIFSAVVLTVYFPLYITQITGANWFLGAATTSSMLLAGLTVPLLGGLTDTTGRTKSYLVKSTLVTVLLMALLGIFKRPGPLLMVFMLGCITFHISLVFYHALLVEAAPPEKQGFASGLGTGLGYLGVVLILPLSHYLDQTFGRPFVFPAGACLFLVFSLPLFFWVPERTVDRPQPFRWNLWQTEWKKTIDLIRGMKQRPAALFFFLGNFFIVDTLNSMIVWFAVYMREVFSPGQSAIIAVMLAVNLAAFVWGLANGWLTDRFGALKTLLLAAGILAVTLCGMMLAPHFAFFVALSITGGGFALAGVWTSGRKVVVELAPPKKVGAYFGLYSLTNKVSVLGSLIFSVLADLAGFRIALFSLLIPAVLGFGLLTASRIRMKKNQP